MANGYDPELDFTWDEPGPSELLPEEEPEYGVTIAEAQRARPELFPAGYRPGDIYYAEPDWTEWYSPDYAHPADRSSLDRTIQLAIELGRNQDKIIEALLNEGVAPNIARALARQAVNQLVGVSDPKYANVPGTKNYRWAVGAGKDVTHYQERYGVQYGEKYEPWESKKHLEETEAIYDELMLQADTLEIARHRALYPGMTREEAARITGIEEHKAWNNLPPGIRVKLEQDMKWEELIREKAEDLNVYLNQANSAFDIARYGTSGYYTLGEKIDIANIASEFYRTLTTRYPDLGVPEFPYTERTREKPPTEAEPPPVEGYVPEMPEPEVVSEVPTELPFEPEDIGLGKWLTDLGREIWRDLPINPYYWKTPVEKAEIEQRRVLLEFAKAEGKENPEKWVDELLAQETGLVVMRAAEEREYQKLPDAPIVFKGHGLPPFQEPLQKLIGEWIIPIAAISWIPGFGVVQGWFAKHLGTLGKIVAKTLTPAVWAEAAPSKAITKVAEKVFKPKFPELIAPRAYVEALKITHPERFKTKADADAIFQEIRQYNLYIREVAQNAPPPLMAGLTRKGLSQELFKLKPVKGSGGLYDVTVTASYIKPKVKGASMAIADVIGKPTAYNWTGKQGRMALQFAKAYHEVEATLLSFEKKNGILINERWYPSGEYHVGRNVVAEVDANGNVLLERALRRGRLGTKISAEKERFYPTQGEGIAAGKVYATPEESLTFRIQAAYDRAGGLKVKEAYLDMLSATPKQLLGINIKQQYEVLSSSYKSALYIRNALLRLSRGEKLPPQTIAAIQRRNPALATQLERISAGKMPIRVIKGEVSPLEVDVLSAELAGLQEWLETVPARQLVPLIKKTGWHKGEISNLTKRQYTELTGRQPSAASLTPDKKHVRWEYALDDAATELGYADGEALREAIESASVSLRRISELKGQIKHLAAMLPRREVLTQSQAIRALIKQNDASLSTAKTELQGFAPIYRQATAKAKLAAFSEGRIWTFPAMQNRIFADIVNPHNPSEILITGKQVVTNLNNIFGVQRVSGAWRTASDFARTGVSLTAAMDGSYPFIQGPMTLGRDAANWAVGKPSAMWAKSTFEMLKTMLNPRWSASFDMRHAATLARAPLLIRQPSEFVTGFGVLERWSAKVPVVGGSLRRIIHETYGRMGAGFSSAAKASRVLLYENMEKSWLKHGGDLTELQLLCNQISGAVSLQYLGVSPQRAAVESATLFAPSFTRSWLMNIRDLFRGTMKAREVQKAMAGMFASMFTAYITVSAALGQEPKLNPAPTSVGGDGSQFLSIEVGGVNVGAPGWGYSLLRLVANVGAAVVTNPESLIKLDMSNPVLRTIFSKASPLVGLAKELGTQRDYFGNRLEDAGDWAVMLADKVIPIAAQSLLEKTPESNVWVAVGAELLGIRTYPVQPWERLSRMQQDLAGEYKDENSDPLLWDDLGKAYKDEIRRKNPEFAQLEKEINEEWATKRATDEERTLWLARQEVDEKFNADMTTIAQQLKDGQITPEEYRQRTTDIRRIHATQNDLLWRLRELAEPEAEEDYERYLMEEAPMEDRYMHTYWEYWGRLIEVEPNLDDGAWERIDTRMDEWLNNIQPYYRAYIVNFKDDWVLDMPEPVKGIELARNEAIEHIERSGYWNIPAENQDERTQMRAKDPKLDAALLFWYGPTSPQSDKALELVIQQLTELGLPETAIADIIKSASIRRMREYMRKT